MKILKYSYDEHVTVFVACSMAVMVSFCIIYDDIK